MILIFKKMNSESLGFSALDQRLNYSIKKNNPKNTLYRNCRSKQVSTCGSIYGDITKFLFQESDPSFEYF